MINTLDLLGSQRVEKALFTTFALSLTFFESYVIPRLRKAGCEQVFVLCDALGYRSSLMERRCRYVGQEFSLVPVTLKNGIFHPKMAYLWGQDADLLLVGSGNLTFGGYGKNLEVLDVLESDTHGRAYQDFAAFLQVLADSTAVEIADTSSLESFKQRALAQSRKSSLSGNARLLHSIEQPISDQVVDLAREYAWDELFVLSPFHSADGGPIRQIAESLDIDSINIGVSGMAKTTTSFPFDKAASWGKKIAISKPRVGNAERSLHAKWLELRGTETWALTGSVNATRQSMGSTNNVEVGVLRVLDEATQPLWEPAERPTYKSDNFPSSLDSEAFSVVYAEIDRAGYLVGRILNPKSSPEGGWRIDLENSEVTESSGDVLLDEGANFSTKLESFQFFGSKSALQVRLTRGDQEARGWVVISGMLKQSSRARTALSALSRMLAADEIATDASVLLEFISSNVEQATKFLTEYRGSRGKGTPLPTGDVKFSIEELNTWRDTDSDNVFLHLGAAAQQDHKQLTVLAAMGRLLLGKKPQSKEANGLSQSYRRVLVDVTDEVTGRLAIEAQSELDSFNQGIRNALRDVESEEEGYDGLPVMLLVWCHANIWMQLARFGNVSAAFTFADEWMRIAARSKLSNAGKKILEETLFGIASALAHRVQQRMGGGHSETNALVSLAAIHEWLSNFCVDEPDTEKATSLAASWLSHGVPLAMVSEDTVGVSARV